MSGCSARKDNQPAMVSIIIEEKGIYIYYLNNEETFNSAWQYWVFWGEGRGRVRNGRECFFNDKTARSTLKISQKAG